MNFAALLIQRLTENSCLIDAPTGETVSASDIPPLIAGFARGFLSSGLEPGDHLLLGCGVNSATALAYLGAIYAGIVPVPVEDRLLATSGEALVQSSGAKAVWTEKKSDYDWVQESKIQYLQGKFQPQPAESVCPSFPDRNDLAALMPTSGSTGLPRLVMVSHTNLISNTEAIVSSQGLGIGERAMLIMPVSYCFGASVLHTHLWQGGGVVFDPRFMFADKVLNAINTFECASFAGVPIVYNVLLRRSNLKSIPLPRLRRFLQAGGALATENVEEMTRIVPHAEFVVMYGQTEATARISCLPASRLHDKLGSAGLPLDNLEIRIADELGREVDAGRVGEIQVRGPSVCMGYLNDPESTERKFGGGWLKTGDFASRDDEGYLWIKGRTDDFIKIRGVRVSVGEVEAKVGAMAGISECAAVGVKHEEAGEALALLVVTENGSTESVAERVRRLLPSHWTCVSVKVVPQLPRTTNGKIARAQLHSLL